MLPDSSEYFDLNNYKRVLQVANTPGYDEFMQVFKITAAGILFLGAIGYVIYAIVFLLPGGV